MVDVFDVWNEEKKRIDSVAKELIDNIFIKARQVWNVKLGCNIGTEQNGKTGFVRPVLVVKKIGSLYFCAPLTSRMKTGRWYYQLKSEIQRGKTSTIILSQGRTIDKRRFFKHIGIVSQQEFVTIKKLLQDMYL